MIKIFIESIMFLFGIGHNPIPKHHYKSDRDAMTADWKAIGMDIKKSIDAYGKQQ